MLNILPNQLSWDENPGDRVVRFADRKYNEDLSISPSFRDEIFDFLRRGP